MRILILMFIKWWELKTRNPMVKDDIYQRPRLLRQLFHLLNLCDNKIILLVALIAIISALVYLTLLRDKVTILKMITFPQYYEVVQCFIIPYKFISYNRNGSRELRKQLEIFTHIFFHLKARTNGNCTASSSLTIERK